MRTGKLVFNHASLKAALTELGIDFLDGHKEFVMQCIWDDCKGHKRPMYLNCDERAGVFHCFRCGRTGFFDEFVRAFKPEWTIIRVSRFCQRFRAFDDPNDAVESYRPVVSIDEELLAKFSYRHEYCYDRGLSEKTLRRYRVGYDKENNQLIFPWFDIRGQLIAMKKRSLMDKHYSFIGGGSYTSLLYGLHLIKPRSVIWLAEGEFDAMWLDQCFSQYSLNLHGAVALGGKMLYDAGLENLLAKAPLVVVLATDNDDDGSKAAARIAKDLATLYVPTYRLEYDGGKDPNETSADHIVKQAAKAEKAIKSQQAKLNSRFERWQMENAQ